ncbi:hypothetical protein [Flavobacterium sangjuense]|uniref:Uncharacterized protein n=1 Tax=Flavobacterium sangjuense TaxID=2518177 RepID=A0A4P7PV44_9FLAO|nr:hypothetical protein [Flavobacterium sangjuense]QBZ98575.1 hypothetical protein GS03_02084 [Flavobacterium sangjuense]
MGYSVEIIFGKEQVIKFRQGESLSDYEKLIHRKQFVFETLSERNNFYKGLSESNGWTDFEIINEYQTKLNKDEENEPTFDYWRFIEQYYPNYDHSDSILLSDILTRKLSGQEICESDEEYIKGWDVRKELMELDKELLGKAFENFFNTIYPENTI